MKGRTIVVLILSAASLLAGGCTGVGPPGEEAGSTKQALGIAGCPPLVSAIPIGSNLVSAGDVLGMDTSHDMAASLAREVLVARSFILHNSMAHVFGPTTTDIIDQDLQHAVTTENVAAADRSGTPATVVPLGTINVRAQDGSVVPIPVIGVGGSDDALVNGSSASEAQQLVDVILSDWGVFGQTRLRLGILDNSARAANSTVANADRVGGIPGPASTDQLTSGNQSFFDNRTIVGDIFSPGVFGPDTASIATNDLLTNAASFFRAAQARTGTGFGIAPGTPLGVQGASLAAGIGGINAALGCPGAALGTTVP
jgi:hypothetical protein